MTQSVVVLGNPVLDYVLQMERLPSTPGMRQEIQALSVGPGGAANVLIGAARLGLRVQALGVVGDDSVGRRLLRQLDTEGVITHTLLKLPGKCTPRVFILITSQGERIFLGYHPKLNAPSHLPPDWRDAISRAAAFYCDGWSCSNLGVSLVQQAIQQAYTAGTAVFFDPGPQVHLCPAGQLANILHNTTVLTLTEEEARALLPGTFALPELASALQAHGPRLVVIKRGVHGCLIQRDEEMILHPGFAVPVCDTTAAGDAVSAALLWGWLHHCELPQLAALLNAAGAIAVQRLGGGPNMPHLAEIKTLLQQQGKATDFM